MKKTFAMFLVIFILFAFGTFAYSAGLRPSMPFGGRVTTNMQPNVRCPGYGPISIIPSNNAPSAPYSTSFGGNPVRQNGWILGLYLPMTAYCIQITPSGPIPYYAFPITIYGTSR